MKISRHIRTSTLIIAATLTIALFVARAATNVLYSFVDRGGVSLITRGGTTSATTGYARILPNGQNTTPSGLAIFGFRQGGVLVSEAGVPASPLIVSGRIYAEVNDTVNTGIAIANPGPLSATVSFYFTNANGVDFGAGTRTIPANSQLAAFLNEAPFNAGSSVRGTFTFNSTAPIAVIALRGLTNERSEFLITTLPVTPLSAAASGPATFPHFADGGGWITQVILVNPGDTAISGTVQFFSQGSATDAGQPISMTVNGQSNTTFNYTIERRSSVRLQTSGASTTTASGAIRVTPSQNQSTPSGLVVFSYRNGSITVSEAGVPALRTANAFRLYTEASRPGESILSGVAIANPSSSPAAVNFELMPLAGGTALLTTAAMIPGNGQMAKFLDQIQGLESLPRPFKGVLRVSTNSSAGIAVIGLRSRVNERGDFMITTTAPADEAVQPGIAEAVFPHFVDNGGYTTQFIVYSGSSGQQSSGSIRFFGQNGQSLDLGLLPIADLAVSQPAPASVALGNTLTYSISVTNNGPDEATGVQMIDRLPAGATFESAPATQGSCPTPIAGVLTCDLGSLRPGGTAVVNVVIRPTATSALSNSVLVGSNDDDPITSNNRSVVSASAAPATDLEITQPIFPDDCGLESSEEFDCKGLEYFVRVQNRGPSSATNVIVTDILPTDPYGVIVVEQKTASTPQGSCSTSSVDRVTCNLGTLAVDAIVTIKLTLELNAIARGQQVTNRASVSSADVVDALPENNSDATAKTTVTPSEPQTNLDVVSFSANPTTVTRPNQVTLSATIQNKGTFSTATGLKLTTIFYGPVTFRSASASQGTCSFTAHPQTPQIVCDFGTLARNFPRNVSMVIVPLNSGPLTVDTEIKANEEDLDPQDPDALGATKFRSLAITVN